MKTIDVQKLREWKRTNKDFLFLNVLDKDAFSHEHALGSRHVPLEKDGKHDFADRVGKLASTKDRTIVVYCAGPQCDASEKAARQLDEAGFTNVYDFEGGMQAWKEADMPISASHSAHA